MKFSPDSLGSQHGGLGPQLLLGFGRTIGWRRQLCVQTGLDPGERRHRIQPPLALIGIGDVVHEIAQHDAPRRRIVPDARLQGHVLTFVATQTRTSSKDRGSCFAAWGIGSSSRADIGHLE